MRKLDRASAERALRERTPQMTDVLKALPPGVDADLVADRVVELVGSPWRFARACRRLPPPVILGVLRRFSERPDPWCTFVRAYVAEADGDLAEAWRDALDAILSLSSSYSFGSRKYREKIASVVGDPRGIEAARATAATSAGPVPESILAVLLVDGREASIDALVPTFDRAFRGKGEELDRVTALARIASGDPCVQALLLRARTESEARKNPALDLELALFGDHAPRGFWFALHLGSIELLFPEVPRFQVNVRVDSRSAKPYAVSVSEATAVLDRGTYFDAEKSWRDGLELGRSDLFGVPAYLARAAERLTTGWDWDRANLQTNVRGRKRARIVEWLQLEPR